MNDIKKIQEFFSKPLEENTFKKGDKVTYLGHPGEITSVEDRFGKTYLSVSYDKGEGKTKARGILATDGSIKPLKEGEKSFADYDNKELAAYVKNTKDKEAAKELHKRSQKLKNLSRTDINEGGIEDIKKQLDALGVKYEMSGNKFRPFKAIYKPLNKSDKWYDEFEDIIYLFNLGSAVKQSMDESLTAGYPHRKISGEGFEKIVIVEPMDDATRERMIRRFEAEGWDAKPNNGGGITAIKKTLMNEIEYLNPGKRPIITNKQGQKFVIQGFTTSGYYLIPYDGKKYWEPSSVSKDKWIPEKDINWNDYNFSQEQFNNLKAEKTEKGKEISKKFQDMNEAKSEDAVDTITMDIPLFLRMLEYSREDASQDMDLHDVTEKANKLGKERGILQMDDYEEIVGADEELAEAKLSEAYVPSNIKEFAKRKGVSSLVNKVAGWAEKVGKKITGGTAVGYNYSTLILDMTYQGSEISINTDDDTIELYDEPVYSFIDFKQVYLDNQDESDNGLAERIAEALDKINEELCPAGKAYIKRRKAAGEKSSAYLSGRAVKVCKGQMSGKSKKK